jgi:hypothetical protein
VRVPRRSTFMFSQLHRSTIKWKQAQEQRANDGGRRKKTVQPKEKHGAHVAATVAAGRAVAVFHTHTTRHYTTH